MIKNLKCDALSNNELEDLVKIFSGSFTSDSPEQHVLQYVKTVDRVLIYYSKNKPCAFLFFQLKQIDGITILHCSLSGKVGGPKGVQKKLGTYLYFNYVFAWSKLFKLSVFVTVSNNPRSYFNMRSIGGKIFPDVLKPTPEFEYETLYRKIPNLLNLENVQANGTIPGRCRELGFSIRDSETNIAELNDKGRQFMHYIEDNSDNGVLVAVFVRPIVDIPRYYLKRILRLSALTTQRFTKKPNPAHSRASS